MREEFVEVVKEFGENTETAANDLAHALAEANKCNEAHSLGLTEEEMKVMSETMNKLFVKRNLDS